jgi:glucosamine-6-phosphate deaminase
MMPRLDILPAAAWADRIAGDLAERVAAQRDLRVCLPTGSTPAPVYLRLPDELVARRADASRVTVVLLDEYLGLPSGHPARCDAMLRRQLLDRLTPSPAFIPFEVDDAAGDPETACRLMDAAIGAAGGLDLAILGLGANGHVGMNEPGTRADAPTRPVDLAPSTIEAARGYGADPPPTRGVTLGLGPLMAAREVWLLVRGEAKAAILVRALESPRTPDCPASLLRDHPRLRVVTDESAAAALSPSTRLPRSA